PARPLVEGWAPGVSQSDGARLPQHVHALRPQLAARLGWHLASRVVPDLVALYRTVPHRDDPTWLLAGAGHPRRPRSLQRGARHRGLRTPLAQRQPVDREEL